LLGFRSGVVADSVLLGYDARSRSNRIPACRRKVVSSFGHSGYGSSGFYASRKTGILLLVTSRRPRRKEPSKERMFVEVATGVEREMNRNQR